MKSAYLFSILAGILIGTSYIPLPPWAIFFGFVPLWLVWLECQTWKQVFLTGWITQFVLTLIGFNWVSYTVHEFGHLSWVASLLVLFGFCSICTLSIPVFGTLWWFFCRYFKLNQTGRVIALPVFLSLGDRVFPMIFDWHFGYTWLWAGFPAYQLADVIGFIGLANIGMAFNAALLWGYLKWRGSQVWWPWPAGVLTVFLVMNLAGYVHGQGLTAPDKSARFLIAQANIGNEEKLMAEQGWAFRDTVINKWTTLTEKGLQENPNVDFAVWPETAFPEFIDTEDLSQPYPAKLKQIVQRLKINLITGGYSHLQRSRRPTNSFFILNHEGHWLDKPYHKTMLLAFGEYFPGANLFPKVREWFPEVADFGRGPGPTVLQAGQLKIGAQICYEGLFDWFARDLANKGAQVIVNITNDSWYGTWQQPYQHLYMTLAHAIEIRRPLVRATNTGISTVILASGKILENSPLHQEWQHAFTVDYLENPPTTFFMGWGFWLLPVLLGLTLVLLPFTSKKL